jgi:hypothetical protein
MKRFLRKVGLLTAAMMMLSGVAYADVNGAVAANKWVRDVPTDNLANANPGPLRTATKLNRNQTLYFGFEIVGGTGHKTLVNGVRGDCTIGDGSIGCASAPLFIASTSAVVCVDWDIATVGDIARNVSSPNVEDAEISTFVCSDETCSRATSAGTVGGGQNLAADTSAGGQCSEFMNDDQYDGVNIGGNWVYLVLNQPTDASPTVVSSTILLWIVGN